MIFALIRLLVLNAQMVITYSQTKSAMICVLHTIIQIIILILIHVAAAQIFVNNVKPNLNALIVKTITVFNQISLVITNARSFSFLMTHWKIQHVIIAFKIAKFALMGLAAISA